MIQRYCLTANIITYGGEPQLFADTNVLVINNAYYDNIFAG